MEQLIILQGITVDQMLTRMGALIEEKISEYMKPSPAVKPLIYMTRKEVADYLRVSLPTLHDWTKMGWVQSYKIGNRVLFKSDEVEKSLTIRKYRR